MRRIVIDRLGDQRPDDAQFIGHSPQLRELIANFLPRLTELGELVLRAEALQLLPLKLRDRLPLRDRLGHRLPVLLGQLRLVVECFEVTRPSRHAEMNDPLRLRRPMQRRDDSGPASVRR